MRTRKLGDAIQNKGLLRGPANKICAPGFTLFVLKVENRVLGFTSWLAGTSKDIDLKVRQLNLLRKELQDLLGRRPRWTGRC